LFYLIIIVLNKTNIMEKNFKYWKEEDFDYWVNQKTNWVVKEISRGEEEQWVMLDTIMV